MGATPPVGQSKGVESTQGVLFRLGARAGLLVFAGVMVVAVQRGMDPTLALLRALVALLAIMACGWAAERIALPPLRTRVTEPAEAEDLPASEAAAEGGDEPETRRAAA